MVSRFCPVTTTAVGNGYRVPTLITLIAASQVSYTATDGGPPTSANHCWTPSIRCARPHGLELCAGRSPRTAGLESFRQGLKTWLFSRY